MKIQKSAKDYLEMILRLRETKGYVRSVDIANPNMSPIRDSYA